MDPYVYPGINVLRNLRGIRDPARLAELEAQATSFRIRQLEQKPLQSQFETPHLQAIHRHTQDVYGWAGKFRTVNTLQQTFQKLRAERLLSGQNLEQFAKRAAYYLGEINAIHPFREGNGRTQREFVREVANNNGWRLEWSRFTRDQMMDASKRSFRRDNLGLEQVLWSALRHNENVDQ